MLAKSAQYTTQVGCRVPHRKSTLFRLAVLPKGGDSLPTANPFLLVTMHRVSIQAMTFKRERMELQVPEAFRSLTKSEFPPLPVDESEHFYFSTSQVVLVPPSDGPGSREAAVVGWCKAIAVPRMSLLKRYNVPRSVLETYACPQTNLQYLQAAPDFMTKHLLARRTGSFWVFDNQQEAWLVHVASADSKPQAPDAA